MNIPGSPSAPSPAPWFSPPVRRLFSWRTLRWTLLAFACVATLLAVFYTEEYWRGKQVWERCRRDLEAKGETLDWNAFIPGPVPDEQNVFKAPNIQEWFVKQPSDQGDKNQSPGRSGSKAPFTLPSHPNTKDLLLADVRVLPSNAPFNAGKADAVLRFDDPAAAGQAAKICRDATGPSAGGIVFHTFLARPLDQIKPLHLILQSDASLSSKALARFFPTNLNQVPSGVPSTYSCLQVVSTGSNTFNVLLKDGVYAAEYLEWTGPLAPDFDTLRKALARPYVRMDGDYEQPLVMPIPNFVRVRTVVQILAQRAQCFLLLGQPEAAWHELSLVRDLCRLLHTQPGGRPLTLVAQMIDTAVTGVVYVMVVKDGLNLRAWHEPQLVAIQEQLRQANLLPGFVECFRAERVGSCHALEITSLSKLAALIRLDASKPALLERLKVEIIPRGWVYHNMAAIAALDQGAMSVVNLTDNLILPRQAEEQHKKLLTTESHFSPYTFLAVMVVPNYLKAAQTVARNQTLVNEAFVACGLERFRLAHGQYPDALEALVPQFIDHLPHDIIGGGTLKYRHTADAYFVLYSIGLNEKDDGGVPGGTIEDGDWVWE